MPLLPVVRGDRVVRVGPMTRRGLVLFGLMSIIWGIPYFMIRIAVGEITPATMVFFRTLIAAALLFPIAAARVDMRATLRRWPWVVAFAVVEIAIPWVLIGAAEQQISSSLAALLLAGVPLAGVMIALVTGSAQRIDRLGLAGLALGLSGVAAIVGGDFKATGLVPLAQMGLAVVGYALGPAILARQLAGLPSLAVLGIALAISSVLYLPISLVSGWPVSWPSTEVVASVVTLAVVCTAAAFLVFAELIKEIGPVRATVITYVNPAVAAVAGVLILHEALTVPMMLGFALVISGSWLATRAAPPAGPAPSAAETARSSGQAP